MKKSLSIFTFAALILGVIAGIYCSETAVSLSFIGTVYINILKLLIVPVVFTSISTSIYNAKGNRDRLVLKTVALFVVMFVATFLLTSLVVTLINPAQGFSFDVVEWNGSTTSITIGSLLINLLPTSFDNFIKGGKLFLVIIIAFIVGFANSRIKGFEKVNAVLEKIKEYLFRFLTYFMYVTPFAVFSLISNTIATYGAKMIIVGIRYILTAYLSGLLTIILIMILPVWLICRISPKEYITKVSRIWLMTLTTCSSSATLPYTMKVCKEQFDIDGKVTDIVVPLGCTIHMCGGAVSFALLGLFCSKLFGIEITFAKYLLMIVASVLINMSAPGIPNGGVVIGATYLQLLGVPLDFVGFYSSIYKVLDMLYTTLNVTGDITANNLINKSLK